MKLKVVIIIGILAIITLPSISAQFQKSDSNTNDDTNKTNTGYNFIFVCFSFGRITNLDIFGHGYCLFYTFDAINVICILATKDHPLPFIHRFNNGETLGMAYPSGIITEDFIFAIGC